MNKELLEYFNQDELEKWDIEIISPIYTKQTKCQNYSKCKCKRSRLHPIGTS